jgi:hypothetical protein
VPTQYNYVNISILDKNEPNQIHTNNKASCFADSQRVKKRVSIQVCVDQSNNSSDFCQTQPENDELRSVIHQQSNDISLFDTLGDSPMGNCIGFEDTD